MKLHTNLLILVVGFLFASCQSEAQQSQEHQPDKITLKTVTGIEVIIEDVDADSVTLIKIGKQPSAKLYFDEYSRSAGTENWVFETEDATVSVFRYQGFITVFISTDYDEIVAYTDPGFKRLSPNYSKVWLVDNEGITYKYVGRKGDFYEFAEKGDATESLFLLETKNAFLVTYDLVYVQGSYYLKDPVYMREFDDLPRYFLHVIYSLY